MVFIYKNFRFLRINRLNESIFLLFSLLIPLIFFWWINPQVIFRFYRQDTQMMTQWISFIAQVVLFIEIQWTIKEISRKVFFKKKSMNFLWPNNSVILNTILIRIVHCACDHQTFISFYFYYSTFKLDKLIYITWEWFKWHTFR